MPKQTLENHAIVWMANLTTCSGVAKIDSHASRVTVYAGDEPDEPMGQFYRPTAPSSARAKTTQESASERSASRRPAEPASSDSEDREDDAFLRARRRVPVRRGL